MVHHKTTVSHQEFEMKKIIDLTRRSWNNYNTNKNLSLEIKHPKDYIYEICYTNKKDKYETCLKYFSIIPDRWNIHEVTMRKI